MDDEWARVDDAAAFLARYRFGHIYEERVHSPSCRKCQLEAEAKGIKVGRRDRMRSFAAWTPAVPFERAWTPAANL